MDSSHPDPGFVQQLLAEAKRAGISRYVVGGVIIKCSKALILRRPRTDYLGGMYEIPSGRVEAGESLLGALEREVLEETGLRIAAVGKYLGYFDYASKMGAPTRQFNFLILVQEPLQITLSEHDAYEWVRKDRLSNYAISKSTMRVLKIAFEEGVSGAA